MKLQLLQQAIGQKKPISFEYNKPGKVHGKRYGNTHAIYTITRKDTSKSIKVHIVQTSGATDSDKDFPEFRTFDIINISNICILHEEPSFIIDKRYNPAWTGYADVIAKV